MATPALTQSKKAVLNGIDSTSLTFDSTPAWGSTVIVFITTYGATTTHTVTDNKGNVYTQARQRDISANNEGSSIWYCKNVMSSATFTVTVNPGGSSCDCTLIISEFSNVDPLSGVYSGNDAGGDSTTPSSGNVTTPANDYLLVGLLVHGNTNRTLTEGTGWTLIQENEGGTTNIPASAIYRVPTAGTYNANWTIGTGSSSYAALVVAFANGDPLPQPIYGEPMKIPFAGDDFRWKISNVDGTRPAGNLGTSLTPGNNSKGSWAQVHTAIAYDTWDVEIIINSGSASAAARNILIDIGYDPAGGTTYTTLVSNLAGSCAGGLADLGGQVYHFPVRIPAGSTIAARASVNNATVGTVRVIINLQGRPAHPEWHKVGSYVVTVGDVSATSTGTTVTPGTTSEGAWASLGSPSKDAWHWQLGCLVNDSTMAALAYFAELGVGDGTTETVIVKDMLVRTDASERMAFNNPSTGCEKYVGTGQTLHARSQCSGNADSNFSCIAYGVGG